MIRKNITYCNDFHIEDYQIRTKNEKLNALEICHLDLDSLFESSLLMPNNDLFNQRKLKCEENYQEISEIDDARFLRTQPSKMFSFSKNEFKLTIPLKKKDQMIENDVLRMYSKHEDTHGNQNLYTIIESSDSERDKIHSIPFAARNKGEITESDMHVFLNMDRQKERLTEHISEESTDNNEEHFIDPIASKTNANENECFIDLLAYKATPQSQKVQTKYKSRKWHKELKKLNKKKELSSQTSTTSLVSESSSLHSGESNLDMQKSDLNPVVENIQLKNIQPENIQPENIQSENLTSSVNLSKRALKKLAQKSMQKPKNLKKTATTPLETPVVTPVNSEEMNLNTIAEEMEEEKEEESEEDEDIENKPKVRFTPKVNQVSDKDWEDIKKFEHISAFKYEKFLHFEEYHKGLYSILCKSKSNKF
jgi:hypothetical protein